MAYSTKWFTDVRNLKSISRGPLELLLGKYKEDLLEKGITIPNPPREVGKEKESDNKFYDELSDIFFHPEGIPTVLHDALYYIREMDNEAGHVQITQAVLIGKLRIDLTQPLTRADCAILAWIDNEDTVKALHMNLELEQTKSYVYFQASGDNVPAMIPFETVRASMEKDLDAVFATRSRGRGSEIKMHKKGDDFWFVITHGEPFKRDGCRHEDKSDSVFYRPESTDVVVFNTEHGDLRMNVYAKWHKTLYRDVFEKHLFGHQAGFTEAERYTLEPLRTKMEAALETSDDAIKFIQLHAIEFLVDEATDDRVTRTAEDVYAAYARDARLNPAAGFPADFPITKASFKVAFVHSKKQRSVVITAGNRAKYVRDEDSHHIETWLREQKMILPRPTPDVESPSQTLAAVGDSQSTGGH